MKKILVLFADGFEEIEALSVVDFVRRAGIEVTMASVSGTDIVKGSIGIEVKTDAPLEDALKKGPYDGVVVPGGLPGATNLRDDERVIDLVKKMNDEGKLVAAICAAPIVPDRAGVLKGKRVTSYPDFKSRLRGVTYEEKLTVRDGNIITSRGPSTAIFFAVEIVRYLLGDKAAEDLSEGILLNWTCRNI